MSCPVSGRLFRELSSCDVLGENGAGQIRCLSARNRWVELKGELRHVVI